MRIRQNDSDALGSIPVFCDICDREIFPEENRRSCCTCKKDYCENCPACTLSEHNVAIYRGFPRLTLDRKALLGAVGEYLDECFGNLFPSGNVFLVHWLQSLELVLAATEGSTFPVVRGPLKGKDRTVAALLWAQEYGERYLTDWVSLRRMDRFVDYCNRRAFAGRAPNLSTYMHSQGGLGPLKWKGKPMMRTVWDFALSAIMVQEIRPATIIEFGTATGASAIWYADLQSMHELKPNVISMDEIQVPYRYDGVSFLKGVSEHVEEHLTTALLTEQPHPWLVIEDAHCNIRGILDHLHKCFKKGDYFAIEDVDAEADLIGFLSQHRDTYKVDTRYTDFFGHNATCAADQIFCRVS